MTTNDRQTKIPHVYVRPGPMGPMPMYWRDEQSGELAAAVMALADVILFRRRDVTDEQLALLWDYVGHHINAPCWVATCAGAYETELEELKRRAQKRGDLTALRVYVDLASEIALDPF